MRETLGTYCRRMDMTNLLEQYERIAGMETVSNLIPPAEKVRSLCGL